MARYTTSDTIYLLRSAGILTDDTIAAVLGKTELAVSGKRKSLGITIANTSHRPKQIGPLAPELPAEATSPTPRKGLDEASRERFWENINAIIAP